MTKKWILGLLLVPLLLGCATLPPPVVIRVEKDEEKPVVEEDPFRVFPEAYRVRAVEYEKKGELSRALLAWKIVRAFRTDNQEDLARMERLQSMIKNEANGHLEKGKEYLSRNLPQAARREFLSALVCDPEHEEALVYLKTRTAEPDYTIYEVKRGDTIGSIAKRIYGDQGKDFLIAYFNDLGSGDQVKPGMALNIPVLEQEPRLEAKPEMKREAKSRSAPPPKVYDKKAAEDHYRKGLNYFLAEDLQGAIREWEETLRLDPEHTKAKRDIEKARSLLVHMGLK